MGPRIDVDHNATTRVDPRVRDAMLPALSELYGNPSSIHEEGRRAREAVERSRREVAALIGGTAEGVVFTSGGTEADALAVAGGARAARVAGRGAKVVISPLEHPAVHGAAAALVAEGFEVATLAVDGDGRIDLDDAARKMWGGGVALVSVALANHEIGAVADVAALAKLARAAGALVHTDAVQAAGKMVIDVEGLDVDLASVSAHKIYGPKGVGALWLRRGVELVGPPAGGHQERGRRPGTENVAGVVGLGEAARLAREELPDSWTRVEALRDRLEAAARELGARVYGAGGRRLGNTTNLAWQGVPGDVLVAALDLEGISASTGAACTSGSVEPSPVILALGVARERAAEAVRLSLGAETTEADIDRVLAVLGRVVPRIRESLDK